MSTVAADPQGGDWRHVTRNALLAIVLSGAASSCHARSGNLGSLDMYVVPPISSIKILGNTRLPDKSLATTIEFVACAGEFEPASFVFHALETDVVDVRLVVSDLIDHQLQKTIPSENLDIRSVKPWFQSYYAWNEIGKSAPDDFRQVLVPELLLKDDSLVVAEAGTEKNYIRIVEQGAERYEWVNRPNLATSEQVLPSLHEFPVRDSRDLQPFVVPSSTSKQLWATLSVPDGTSPGNYQGTIQVRSGEALLGVIVVQARVLPLNLSSPSIEYAIYYRAQLDPLRASIGSEFRDADQMKSELVDMVRHGIRSPTVYQAMRDRVTLEKVLRLRSDAGLENRRVYYLGIQTTESFLGSSAVQQRENLRRSLMEFRRVANSVGYDEILVYGRDEAVGKALEEQRELWGLVHLLGSKMFVAGSSGAHPVVGDLLDVFVHSHQASYTEAEKWHRTGKRIFNYANPQTGPENPYLFRLNYGVVLWANEYDGAMPYAYQHCFGSCWNDVDHPTYRDHNLTYPAVDGSIPTIAWEALREGIDDVRYLELLERLVIQKPSARGSAAARIYLDSLRNDVRRMQASSGKYNQRATLDLDLMRRDIANYALAIDAEPSRQ